MLKVINRRKIKDFDVNIGRGSLWGNPWGVGLKNTAEFKVSTRQQAVENFEKWLRGEDFVGILPERRQKLLDNLWMLENKILGCWCLDENGDGNCHGLVLIKLIQEKK